MALPFTGAMALSAQHSTGAAWGWSPGLTAVVLLIQSGATEYVHLAHAFLGFLVLGVLFQWTAGALGAD